MLQLLKFFFSCLPEWDVLLPQVSHAKDANFFCDDWEGGNGILWVTEFLLIGTGPVFQSTGFPS